MTTKPVDHAVHEPATAAIALPRRHRLCLGYLTRRLGYGRSAHTGSRTERHPCASPSPLPPATSAATSWGCSSAPVSGRPFWSAIPPAWTLPFSSGSTPCRWTNATPTRSLPPRRAPTRCSGSTRPPSRRPERRLRARRRRRRPRGVGEPRSPGPSSRAASAPNCGTAAGEIDDLARTEERLDATGASVVHLRCGYFFSNLLLQIDAVRAGVVPIVLPADQPMPWVAPATSPRSRWRACCPTVDRPPRAGRPRPCRPQLGPGRRDRHRRHRTRPSGPSGSPTTRCAACSPATA